MCKLCGCTGAPKEHWEVDHIAPLCEGGADVLENLQIICKACHTQKTQLETLSFVEESNPLMFRFPWKPTELVCKAQSPHKWLQISTRRREERSQSTSEGLGPTPSLKWMPATFPFFTS